MVIKEEVIDYIEREGSTRNNVACINISSSSSSSSSSDEDLDNGISSCGSKKRRRLMDDVLPLGFLDPLTPEERMAMQASTVDPCSKNKVGSDSCVSEKALAFVKEEEAVVAALPVVRGSKQFWKAGDYQPIVDDASTSYSVGMDHVRVHPKFLHSNATSHKWALGAFAELLDNALDEARNGASYVCVDVLENKKEEGKMLLVEDNGGGMSPDNMRQCMSLGYSEKSKLANTIGQYGNGFKTSTMRLGADVIVFSRCLGKDGTSTTQSIGLLSYTFLRSTGKQDIVVPMIDYEKWENTWTMMPRSSLDDWKRNLDTIVQWSPYEHEEDLLQQFDFLESQGTRIIIYNLWEDDDKTQELDFKTDPTDIQIKGVNRDKKKIEMAKTYHNSRHFLTYQHSLRSYASILYLRVPANFRIILRNKDVVHHSIVNDMMHIEEITYKPVAMTDGETPKCSNMVANVTVGFVKDAIYHIDIQGFNVYHKNRLIKPFWRVWNAAGSSGRGVIGVLEANFVEPAHDKQGFERTAVLSRLENRLVKMQKNFWRKKSHLIGYAKQRVAGEKEATPLARDGYSSQRRSDGDVFNTTPSTFRPIRKQKAVLFSDGESDSEMETRKTDARSKSQSRPSPVFANPPRKSIPNRSSEANANSLRKSMPNQSSEANNSSNGYSGGMVLEKLRQENLELRKRSEAMSRELQFEKDRSKSLESQIEETKKMLKDLDKDQELIVDTFLEERGRRDIEEENMRKKLNEASDTIQQLVSRLKLFESRAAIGSCKKER